MRSAKEIRDWAIAEMARRIAAEGANLNHDKFGEDFIHYIQADALEAAALALESHDERAAAFVRDFASDRKLKPGGT